MLILNIRSKNDFLYFEILSLNNVFFHGCLEWTEHKVEVKGISGLEVKRKTTTKFLSAIKQRRSYPPKLTKKAFESSRWI